MAIHPCYWQALDLQDADLPLEVVVNVHDDYEPTEGKEAIRDQRLKQLGRILAELDQIDEGVSHAGRFEAWVHGAVVVLFAGALTNAVLHPNKNAAQRRDIVATNAASGGFWKRILDDYSCRQVVFEVKNYAELGPAEFNQAVAYGGQPYGKASFIVTRGTPGLDDTERAQIKSRYYGTQHLIVVIPASMLRQCLTKQRSQSRQDYTEDALSKLLDTYERQYLGVDAQRRSKRRRRRRTNSPPKGPATGKDGNPSAR